MKLILLLPILAYLGLMLVNLDLLRDFQTLNVFGAISIDIPLIMFSSCFIILYALLVYIVYSGLHSLQAHKIRKLDKYITELKSELYDNQKNLLRSLTTDYSDQLQKFKTDNDHKLETLIRFNQYTLEKVIEETQGSFTKYRKETQKLLKNAKGVDTSILDKIKFWGK